MKKWVWLCVVVAAVANAQVPMQRVADDARVIDRVAQASRKDLPNDLLKRIVNEDLDLLRGKRVDGSYQYATFERLESGRVDQSFSIHARKDEDLQRLEMRGSWVYRLVVGSPSRRMLVTRNRRVYVDRVDIEYVPQGSTATKNHSVRVDTWLEPGAVKTIEFPEVARQTTVRVYARGDAEAGYGNVVLTLIEAKIVDNADSPYAAAVATVKAILKAIDAGEVPSIRAMAARLHDELAGPPPPAATPAASVEVVAPRDSNVYSELQEIEDLLTGTEFERRKGLDRLHQLVRRLRPQ